MLNIKNLTKYLVCEDKVLYILQLSEWLGADLQNLLDEFESHIGVIGTKFIVAKLAGS